MNISYDSDGNDFTKYFNQIQVCNESIHIDGGGGTGKSTLVRMLQYKLTEEGKHLMSLAPTNTASRLINSKTVHKYLAQISSITTNKHKQLDYILVDEISMAHEFMVKLFILIKHKALYV